MIAIVDCWGGNLASVQGALQRLGRKSLLTHDASLIKAASKVILPGVATASYARKQLEKFSLIEVISQLKQPVLGICLGMQLFYESSEEGMVKGLGILGGQIKSLKAEPGLAVPHMGWNRLEGWAANDSPLLKGVAKHSYLYFVHRYFAEVDENTTAIARHGRAFTAIVEKNNFYGLQFHPERSGRVGEQIISNFLAVGESK